MKRFLLILLGVLLNITLFAQTNVPTQSGRATQELPDPGLYAAHPTIQLGSTVTIANADTGEEINVVIISRIPRSSMRIIDLSYDAWEALGLTEDTEVVINPNNEADNAPLASAPTPAPAPQPTPQPAPSPEAPVAASSIEDEEPEIAIQVDYADYADYAELDESPKGNTAAVLSRTPIKIVPGLPNPNSRKVYRLQVGAYAIIENADIAERELKSADFETRREKYGSLTRVLAVGIRADEVRSAVQLIESLGFGEVWIRE